MNPNETRRKRVAGAIMLVLAALLLLGGTFAYTSLNQHKSNEFAGTGLKYDATLIEDFQEHDNWSTQDDPVTKIIAAKNAGLDNTEYGNVLIRLQLKEYMEIGPALDVLSTQRYIIDTSGEFEKFDTEADALAAFPGHVVVSDRGIEDTQDYYYVVSQGKDINGEYGKFLLRDIIADGDASSLVPGVMRASDDAMNVVTHQAYTNGECDYTVHSWLAGSGISEVFRQYVSWNLGADVQLLSEWDGTAGIWVLDDLNPDTGYAYWIGELTPGQRTTDLLESVQLIEQPNGFFYYAIHTDMDAISPDQLSTWSDAPQEIIDALRGSSVPRVLGSTTVIVNRGATYQFDVEGGNDTVTWTLSSEAGGSFVDQNGTLVVGTDETADELTITVADRLDPSLTATITVLVPQIKSVEVTPQGETVYLGASRQFSADVTATYGASTLVTWSVTGPEGVPVLSTITADGLLTVSELEWESALTVTATSLADPTQAGSATVTVTSVPPEVTSVTMNTVSPMTLLRPERGASTTYPFTATVNGTNLTGGVTWSLSPDDAASTIDPESGMLRVSTDEVNSDLTITATAVDDSTKTATAAVQIPTVTSVTIAEINNGEPLQRGASYQLSVSVDGMYLRESDKGATWTVNSTDGSVINFLGLLSIAPSEAAESLAITATAVGSPHLVATAIVTLPPLLIAGDEVPFGGYEWRVLTVDVAGNALITTKDLIPAAANQPFNTSGSTYTGYEGTELDTYLSTTFYSTLSPEDQAKVQPVVLPYEAQGSYVANDTDPSKLSAVSTFGAKKAFALSHAEANLYFAPPPTDATNPDRIANIQPPEYTYPYTHTWWLRSPAGYSSAALSVNVFGGYAPTLIGSGLGVRPALWVRL